MKHLELRHQVSSDIQEDILNIPNIQELMQHFFNSSPYSADFQLKMSLIWKNSLLSVKDDYMVWTLVPNMKLNSSKNPFEGDFEF